MQAVKTTSNIQSRKRSHFGKQAVKTTSNVQSRKRSHFGAQAVKTTSNIQSRKSSYFGTQAVVFTACVFSFLRISFFSCTVNAVWYHVPPPLIMLAVPSLPAESYLFFPYAVWYHVHGLHVLPRRLGPVQRAFDIWNHHERRRRLRAHRGRESCCRGWAQEKACV